MVGASSQQTRFWDCWGFTRPACPARVKREEGPADAAEAREHKPLLLPLSFTSRNASPGAGDSSPREGSAAVAAFRKS